MAAPLENSQHGKASDFYDELSEVCQPCSFEGRRLQAGMFCLDCQEYMCTKCQTFHKALKLTRNHVLVSNEEAKQTTSVTPKDKCSYKCTDHNGKSLKYFCASHSYLGCSVCITIDHKQCQSIDYIPKVAADIRNFDDFKKFDEKLKTLETACKASITDVENGLKQIASDGRQMKEALKEFRIKMNKAFDKFENELITQAKQINNEETNKLNVLSQNLATSLAAVETLQNQVDSLLASSKSCDTYVLMKKEASHLVALNDEIVNTTKGKTFQRYEFQPNNDILKAGVFGKLSSRTECVSLSSKISMFSPSTDDSVKTTVKMSSPSTDDSVKTTVKVSKSNTVTPSQTKQIQPGSRVRHFSARGCHGTVEHYDSSIGYWCVRWDYGGTCYYPTDRLVILKEQ